jgi:hypothetical protein
MAQRLSDKTIERLKVRRKPYVVWDSVQIGLGIKITPKGRRIWLQQLKFPGRKVQTKRTLGVFSEAFGVVAAREKAERWYGLAKSRIDPAIEEEKAQKAAEADRLAEAMKQQNSFASFAERYIGERTNRRADKDAAEIRRLLIKPWSSRPIHEITPDDCEAVIDAIKVHAPYDARNAWTHAVGIFKLARHKKLIAASPMASLDKKLVFRNVKLAHRQRTLDNDELIAFWRATRKLGFPAGPFYRLTLLCATRKNELLKATWAELTPEMRRVIREATKADERVNWQAVAPEDKLVTIPEARFKSEVPHLVPLTDPACQVIERLPRTGPFLFSLDGEKPVWLGTKVKRRLDRLMILTLRALARRRGDDPSQVKLPHWVGHDLRRVVRSALSALGVTDVVAELCIGHGRKGIQRIYDQHKFAKEIRAAMEAWAERLMSIVEPPAPP